MVQIGIGECVMAGIQRFVTYIYAYEDGEKTINTGYAKIEVRGNNGRMEIHLAGDGVAKGCARVSFIYVENGEWKELVLGNLHMENGRGMGQYTFLAETMLDTKLSFDKMIGIQILDEDKRSYMSFWKDVNVIKNRESGWQQEVTDREEEQKEEDLQNESVENGEILEDAEQESLHTMEIPMRNVFPEDTIENSWKKFLRYKECVQINDEVCGIQIELTDLRELPKRYWYMGNNSFLLHGFFNYRHMLFGKLKDGKWFIGVPGIYERQEKVMASIFGFSGFMQVGTGEQITPREKQQGVWYHILES